MIYRDKKSPSKSLQPIQTLFLILSLFFSLAYSPYASGNEQFNSTEALLEKAFMEKYYADSSLPDLLVERMTIPAVIYSAEENPLIITIKNEGGNFSADFNISLRAENFSENQTKNELSYPNVLNLTLSPIPEKEKRIVYTQYNFTNLTQNISLIFEIDPDGKIEEENKENNKVTLNITTYKLYDFYGEKIKNATDNALAYLKNEKDDEGKINDFSSSCLAILSISLNEMPDQDLINYLKNNCTEIINSTEVKDWAIATLAIASLGENPRNLSNINFVGTLKSFFDGKQFGGEFRLDDDCFALLALSSAGEGENELVNRSIANLMKEQKIDGGWNFYGGNSSSVADTSLAIQAILSTGLISSENPSIRKAIEFIKSNQNEDGSFSYEGGGEGSSIPTSLAISALLASNLSEIEDVIKNATDYLLKAQNEEGYFPDYDCMKSTSYAVIALSGEYLPSFYQIVINETLPDVYPINFTVRPKEASENDTACAYANVTNEVIVRIKNNGGAFNVSFVVDGEVLHETRVIEKRSDAETGVKFEWNPNHTGEYNLTISTDTKDEIEEANEENNTISKEIMVILPDLYPDSSLIRNKTFYSNFSNEFPVEARGFGENFNSSLLLNASFVDNITNITCYGQKRINFTWKPEFKGNYSFKVTIDCDDNVKESNEENNTEEGEVKVGLPDILPCNISFLPPANASFENKFLLMNKSNLINVSLKGAGENFNVSLYAYHIKDDETPNFTSLTDLTNLTNDTSLTLIEKKSIARILGMGNVSFSWIPDKKGFYRVIVAVDVDNDVYEENESNNLIYADSEVIVGAPEIRLANPRGGETFINVDYINVRWNATDPDGDSLNISISYSPDYCRSWLKIEEGEENDGIYEWYVKYMPDGEYMLKVEADDGNFTDADITVEPFIIYTKELYKEPRQFHEFSLSEAPDTNDIAWNTTDIGAIDSSQLIVKGGKVFVYCDNGVKTFLVALNESDGTEIWRCELERRAYGSWSSPRYHNENVFLGSGKKVYSIDAEAGNVNWEKEVRKHIVNSCPAIASGKLFIGGYGADGNPEYYCLDEGNGSILWVFNSTKAPEIENLTSPRATATPAFYEGSVFVGFGSWIIGSSGARGAICSLREEDGTQIWNVTTDYGVWGSITAIHGILYLGTYNFDGPATYYAMYPDGSVKWSKRGLRTNSVPFYASNVYISGGCIGYSDIATYCLDPENGDEIWKVEDIGGWTASPVVSSDGKLIVGKIGKGGDAYAADGTYCLDASKGKEIWNSPFGGSTAIIANGRVYTIGQGRVWCFGSLYTPDLNISSFEVPSEVFVGETVLVNVTVKNIGDGGVNKSFNVSLRANGELVDIEPIPSLNVSEEKPFNFSWAAKEKDVGACRLVAEVDPDDKITEKNPLNNRAFRDVVVEDKKPDLAPVDIKTADEIYANSENIIAVIVENIGKEGANNVLVTLKTDINEIGRETIPEINQNENKGLDFEWIPVRSGNFTLTVEVDPGNEIEEMDEGNNVILKEVTVHEKEEEIEPGGWPGGPGGGRRSGVDWIGEGDETGTSETGTGAGAGGGTQKPINESESASDKTKVVSGHPFGDASFGEFCGGGTLPIKLILLFLIVIALFYFGYYKEKRAHKRSKK